MSQTEIKKEVDIVYLVKLLWSKKVRIFKNVVIAGVVAIIVAFSIPKDYTSQVIMAPETSSNMNISGSLMSIASMAGFDMGSMSSNDALYPELYPQMVSSTPFLCDLISLQVTTKDSTLTTSLYDYLKNHKRYPWWSYILQAPGKLLKKIFKKEVDNVIPTKDTPGMFLTRSQQMSLKSLDKLIDVSVDKGNNVISLSVTMQDPYIAAYVAECTANNLQDYIRQYRTAKAITDLQYAQSMYDEAKENYINAQNNYASYMDSHKNLVRMQTQIEAKRLESESSFAFNVYTQMAGQLELAKAKVQESTPVCVVMQPAVAPYKASHPKKMVMGVVYCFLAFLGTCVWYIGKDRLVGKD
ncbi:MAG: Wzz/FepE/Etk N-terminal domain-containing protein [Bacteroidaceae bacterium]|nr:Wzz/FepE/Etk N-terminal domain-containing protein [Bacteroidaceae bacterium]